jgi:hypothetical protein
MQLLNTSADSAYSESYGEGEGDYEEYYDEDVSYNSGDPASAGKGRRNHCVRVLCRYLPIEGALIVSLQFHTFKWFYQHCCGSGIQCFFLSLYPGSSGKKSGSGMNLLEQFFGLKILKFFVAAAGSKYGIFLSRDPG